MKRTTLYFLIILATLKIEAQNTAADPQQYYAAADGKCGAELKSALQQIIANHTKIYYGNLWKVYASTDFVEGKTNTSGLAQVFDYYSASVHYFNADGSTISGMNREHTVPQSWWGGGHEEAWGSDLFHVFPADATANSKKSNYTLGVVSGKTSYLSSRMKTGKDSSGRMVFEPCDEYKGDFARTYLYVATCYPKIWETNTDYAMQSEDYPTLKSWIIPLLLQWNAEDPVSELEIKRQERVARFQHNRNPFIDYPELAEHIWGSRKNENFRLSTAHLSTLNTDTYFYGTIFASTLLGDKAGFTTKNVIGSYTIWKNDSEYGWKASGYVSGSNRKTESWLISPQIELPSEYAVLAFEHAFKYGSRADLSVHVSTDKQNWTELNIPYWPDGSNWTFVMSGDVSLAAFLGKKVYIGFRYTSSTTAAATWEIKKFSIFGGGSTLPTSVETIGNRLLNISNDAVYDLQGRHIVTSSSLPKGIYVRQGKTFIVR